MKNKIVLAMVFLCLIIFGSLQAFRVTPVRLDLTIPRGTTQEIVIELLGSRGAGIEHLLVYPTDISMDRRGGLVFDRMEGSKNSAVPWIKLEEKTISLLEQQKKDLKFKISVPFQADPGEYYAVIMVEPTEFTNIRVKDKPLMLQMKSRIAVVIVIDVPGRIYEKKGEALEVKVEQASDSELKIVSSFRNAGNIHLDVVAVAAIRGKDGRTTFGQVKLIALNSSKEEAFIFPGNTRDFEGILDRALPAGEYLIDVAFDYGYKFRKARLSSVFSIIRSVPVDESKAEFLAVEPRQAEIQIPLGALRTQIIKITNTDYRPISIGVSSDDWVKVIPQSFELKPGEVKKIQAIVSVSEYKEPKKETRIIIKPDRGLPIEIKFSVIESGKNPEKSKKEVQK